MASIDVIHEPFLQLKYTKVLLSLELIRLLGPNCILEHDCDRLAKTRLSTIDEWREARDVVWSFVTGEQSYQVYKYKNWKVLNAFYMVLDDTDTNRKTRKHRVKNLDRFDLEVGKLYQFKGRFRKVYRKRSPELTFEDRQVKDYKIRNGEHVMFLSADLWRVSTTRKKHARPKRVDSLKKDLERQGMKVIRVEGYRSNGRRFGHHRWKRDDKNPQYCYVFYKEPEEKYSGRLYIGHGEKFGWINIVQMSEDKLKEQFERVEL